ncbi:ORF6N domain-containing protein [Thermoanaerobacter thermohydrosulfuricus]|uniref:ORF6N domain-containing protein n=1 Tax=Thermoanaerobacter thermohydrosulfuricus TaxID=1516 RepID=A0A1G7VQE0_THETY|nr:ORF6N domain-containing protein [Thermoanaerobacter thermohydrosulfuricus]SDG61983.1 ORF6N domain-containing protein [Thermoanaerobacter thermohydrosulfuricus]
MNQDTIVKLEWKGQRVLLTKQVAKYYETTENQIMNNFNNNKDKFTEGVHYFKLANEEIRQFLSIKNFDLQISAKTRSLML